MLQFLPAILLLLLQSAPADRSAFVLDWMARHNVAAERPSVVSEKDAALAVAVLAQCVKPQKQTETPTEPRTAVQQTRKSDRLTSGFAPGNRPRDGPVGN